MNRLILIGNGFDLAHGLKTSYKDFIEHLWLGIYEELYKLAEKQYHYEYTHNREKLQFASKNNLIELFIKSIYIGTNNIQNCIYINKRISILIIDTESEPKSISKSIQQFILEINDRDKQQIQFQYLNNFFEIISTNYINKNWSDIEADYYRELKEKRDNPEQIKKLNEDFKHIKELLRKYLSSLEQCPKIGGLEEIIHSPILVNNLSLSSMDIIRNDIGIKIDPLSKDQLTKYWLIKTFPKNRMREEEGIKDKDEIINDILENDERKTMLQDFLLPDHILMLNFNYTKTDELYKDFSKISRVTFKNINIEANHIHGTLDDDDNHMIFGYGDEEDDEYKELEKSETPGLLDNVKSINYLEATNYRDLERFIESAPYQIFIMGMSCGMADRTMLRKLFQHNNCISIKPFYYKGTDKDGKEWDNYTEIVQNISRCFSDKDLLRSTVVNKKDCSLLPQCNTKE